MVRISIAEWSPYHVVSVDLQEGVAIGGCEVVGPVPAVWSSCVVLCVGFQSGGHVIVENF